MSTRTRAAALAGAVLALGLLGSAPVSADTGAPAAQTYPWSQQFGGSDGAVDTYAKVHAVVAALQATGSAAAVQQDLNLLAPSDRSNVVAWGLTPSYAQDGATVSPTTASTASVHGPRSARGTAHIASAGSFHAIAWINEHSLAGNTLWQYNSEWYFTCNGSVVTSATHSEYPTDLFPGYQYLSSSYLLPYGHLDSYMVGREVQGHFQANAGGVDLQDYYPIIQVQVHGDGTWWHWEGDA